MSNKQDFANEISIHSGHMKTSNECFNYGITWGCTIDCPVLQRGECELKDSENKELYKQYLDENE